MDAHTEELLLNEAEERRITRKVRTLGWKPDVSTRMPGGTLTFEEDEHRKGLFAFGKRHDYWVWMDGTTGHVGCWSEGELYDGEPEPIRAIAYATFPNTTRNQMIRQAEEWENGR